MAAELWERYHMPRYHSHFGGLNSQYGYLPMKSMSIQGQIVGLVYRLTLTQRFMGLPTTPIEATYTFPMPAYAGVSRFVMTTQTRKVMGELKERGQARKEYTAAIAQGKQAAMTEQERPDVFTMTVGNIPAGEWVEVSLDLEGPLEWCDNQALFRFPLVVGERFTPGRQFLDSQVGTGTAKDTTEVRDASRVSPPRILAGYPNPVELSIDISVQHASDSWWKQLQPPQSSLMELVFSPQPNGYRIVLPDTANRIDRDLIVRIPMQAEDINTALVCESDGDSHVFMLNVLPPAGLASARQGSRQVVVLLDRSGSMQGWKQTAACRAVCQLVDSLENDDKFNVLAFDDRVDQVIQGEPLARSTAYSRYQAQHAISKVDSRGGTAMMGPLNQGIELLRRCSNPYLILITDGEVTNEKNILQWMSSNVQGVKVYTVGVGTAVNASFLKALSGHNGGTFTQVDSEDSLNQCLRQIRRLIEPPVLQNIHIEQSLVGDWKVVEHASVDLFAGSCQRLFAQAKGRLPESLRVVAEDRNGTQWIRSVPITSGYSGRIITKIWARQQILELEYGNSVGRTGDEFQAPYITAHSLKYGVLSKFTAFLAVDHLSYVQDHRQSVSVTQAVSTPPTGQAASFSSMPATAQAFASDPFGAAQDPFGCCDPFASSGDLFSGGGDPFAEADPFACPSPSAVPDDPFGEEDPFLPRSSSAPFASTADPFSPAPPVAQDPFGSSAQPQSDPFASKSEWQPVPSKPAQSGNSSDWTPVGNPELLAGMAFVQSLTEVDSANSLEALIEAICGLQLQLALALRGVAPAKQRELEALLVKLRDLLVLVSKRGDALTLGELSKVRKEIMAAFQDPKSVSAKAARPPMRDEEFWK
jgi:Ca-activated chloride channel family protein